jgi:predicted O-linked N-acetylglucosamine transferase (SPINDLY family)
VQVSYLGFPGTSGAGLVDYLVCDSTCVPHSEAQGYSEALGRLPRTFWICEPGPAGMAPATREQHGLPPEAVVLYAHHPGRKIEPAIFSAWMAILRAAPEAILWLLEDHPRMRPNLEREAAQRNVDPARLVFAPRAPYAEYRARIGLADLGLDTSVYNGGATTLDALAAGVPVITCPAPGFAGRMAASALRAAGLGDLVFEDLAGYTKAAIELAQNAKRLAKLKTRVTQASASPLFDARSRTRELEAAFDRMHARALQGLKPESFSL